MSPHRLQRVRLLVVDADGAVHGRVLGLLQAAGVTAEVDREPGGRGVLARVGAGAYDCLVVDDALPDEGAAMLLVALRAAGHAVPVLALTASDEDVGEALIAAGATDYLPRAELMPVRLMRRLRGAIRVSRAEAQTLEVTAALERAVHARDELLAIVSHDLRNPLNAVSVAIDELGDASLDPAARASYVAAVRRSLGRAERLIRDLLEISRIEAGQLVLEPRAVDLRAILAHVAQDHEGLAREARMSVEVRVAADVGAVHGDRDRLQQLLGNLIGNALRHARGRGPVELAAHIAGGMTIVEVSDRGPGLPPDHGDRLFDRFWQARSRGRAGAGLGLAIARGIARAHGGDLTARDRPDPPGAVFRLRLPPPP